MGQELSEKRLTRRAVVKGAAALAAVAAIPLSANEAAAANLKIAFSVPGLKFPFFVHMMNQAQQHAAEIGGIDFIPLDGQVDSSKQSSDLEAMVAQKIDGLVISPNDVNALSPAIQGVIDAGIPVVTVDRNVTGVQTLAHVGADNVKGGEAQGQYLVQILPNGGNVFELQGQPGATPAIDRHTGLMNIIGAQDKVKITESQTANFDTTQAVSVTEALLAKDPNPAAIVCANDDMAAGAIQAASESNLTVPIIGFDALPTALQFIRDGQQAATVEQFPGKQASTAIDILVAFIKDKTQPAQHDNYLTPVLITKDNLTTAERAAEAGIVGAGTPVATPTS